MSDDGEKRTTGTGDVVGGRKEIQKPPEFQQLMKPDALASRQESASTYRIVLPRNEAHAYETTFIIQGRITSAELQSLLQGGELFTRPADEFKCQIVERGTGKQYSVNIDTVIGYVGKHKVSVERMVTEAEKFASAKAWATAKSVDIGDLQKKLVELGVLKEGYQPGKFDLTTYRAVVAFQKEYNTHHGGHLAIDGKFGEKTTAAALAVMQPTSSRPIETAPEAQVCDTNDFFEFRQPESKPIVSSGTKRGTTIPTSGDALASGESKTAHVSEPKREEGEKTVAYSGATYRGRTISNYGDLTTTGSRRGSTFTGSGDVNASGDHRTTVIEGEAHRGKVLSEPRKKKEEDEKS